MHIAVAHGATSLLPTVQDCAASYHVHNPHHHNNNSPGRALIVRNGKNSNFATVVIVVGSHLTVVSSSAEAARGFIGGRVWRLGSDGATIVNG
jgi:hypothetical protein